MRHHLITATAALGLLALAAPVATAALSAAAPSTGSGTTAPTCSGSEVTSRLRSGWALPDRARRTAEAIRTDAVGCRQDALVWRTTRDRTRLSFGITTAEQMREAGTGYMGWRVGVSDGGRWMFDIAGD